MESDNADSEAAAALLLRRVNRNSSYHMSSPSHRTYDVIESEESSSSEFKSTRDKRDDNDEEDQSFERNNYEIKQILKPLEDSLGSVQKDIETLLSLHKTNETFLKRSNQKIDESLINFRDIIVIILISLATQFFVNFFWSRTC